MTDVYSFSWSSSYPSSFSLLGCVEKKNTSTPGEKWMGLKTGGTPLYLLLSCWWRFYNRLFLTYININWRRGETLCEGLVGRCGNNMMVASTEISNDGVLLFKPLLLFHKPTTLTTGEGGGEFELREERLHFRSSYIYSTYLCVYTCCDVSLSPPEMCWWLLFFSSVLLYTS